MKRILTIDSLLNYCKENELYSFNSKDTGLQLVVQTPAIFSIDDNENSDGFLHAILRACHIGLNRNGSYISEENMKKYMHTLKYRPILAAIHELDNGEYEFHSHDIEISDDGSVEYIEKQVGVFTADEPWLEYNEEYDKTYVMAKALIPLEYTKAADIIKKHNGTKVSVELVIDSFSYNVKENYLELTDFRFNACTLLGYQKNGTEIGEGMLGSRLDIEDFSFSKDKLSVDNIDSFKQFIEDTVDKYLLDKTNKEGGIGVTKLETLMALYNVTSEDISFEIEGLSDEELEAAFDKAFKKNKETNNIQKCAITIDDRKYEFEVSLNDKIRTLDTLVNDTYADEDNTYYCVTVYEEYVVMYDYWCRRAYKQSYVYEDESYTLTGDRVEVYANWLTKEEEEAMETLRSNYDDLVMYKENIEAGKIRDQKHSILNDEKFDAVRDVEDFKTLINEIDSYSVEDIQTRAKVILADNITKFSYNTKQNGRVGIGYGVEKEEKPYGDLF